MYSLLPGLVSGLFLGFGFHVLVSKGFNRLSGSLFLLCLTTCFWQAAWAVLYQTRDPATADVIVRLGYLPIIFLPTCYYHFLVETTGRRREWRWVWLSYGLALVLAMIHLETRLFLAGRYDYFFGAYPRAGPLHPLHMPQTVVLGLRCLQITLQAAREARPGQRAPLRLCVLSLAAYFFAAGDYLCNYGFAFYPPGVLFIALSLGLMVLAVTRFNLMDAVAVAATMAHEMRTPLASIRMQAETLMQCLPELVRGYGMAVDKGLCARSLSLPDPARMGTLLASITRQVDRSNLVIDMMLASARVEHMDPALFKPCSMAACVREAVDTYPFRRAERERVWVDGGPDFQFMGTEALMVCVLFNLLKNAQCALQTAGRGEIRIVLMQQADQHLLEVRDTATGIRAADLPRIFEHFYTTRPGHGAGLGLPFCRRVVESFGGRVGCDSVEGEYTAFHLRFPALPVAAQRTTSGSLSSSA